LRTPPVLLTGLYEGSRGHADGARATAGDEPLVVFAGRHIPEKRVPAVVRAIAAARATLPGLRGEILGDGPERSAVLRCIADHRLEEAVVAPGVVSAEHVVETLRFAACLVLPSAREGYGMIVIEAAAAGTPSVVVAGPDNAAVELIADGENGFVAASDAPDILGEAIERVILAGAELRDSTEKWYAANAERLSLSGSVDAVLTLYSDSAQAAESRE
jgi:glycosyltransferase involved in cell wall biosynthesis